MFPRMFWSPWMSRCPWTTHRSTILLTAIYVLIPIPLSIQLPLFFLLCIIVHFIHYFGLTSTKCYNLLYDWHFFPPSTHDFTTICLPMCLILSSLSRAPTAVGLRWTWCPALWMFEPGWNSKASPKCNLATLLNTAWIFTHPYMLNESSLRLFVFPGTTGRCRPSVCWMESRCWDCPAKTYGLLAQRKVAKSSSSCSP